MITVYPFTVLGKANHGWLKSSHHFSFANYYNPSRMGFGSLLVVNDDWVKPGFGFPPHPHRNMEIISYVRTGAITHEDNKGHKGVTKNGEVQVMSAGKGVVHSEYNRSKEPLTFYQIWIKTNTMNIEPRWESKKFPNKAVEDALPMLVSGYSDDKNKALFIHQKARIFGGKIRKGNVIEHAIEHQAYVLASDGRFEINDNEFPKTLNKGDGAEVTKSKTITISALTNCEIVIIDAAAE
jgi:redox-sensitive bicupin YhaK (pirin superfamily)